MTYPAKLKLSCFEILAFNPIKKIDYSKLCHIELDERFHCLTKYMYKLLFLICCFYLQTALGTHDLGQFYYKPLKDPSGSTILVSVNFVMDPKVMTFGKWIPISKLQRRQSASMPELSEAQDCLVTSFHVSIDLILSVFRIRAPLYCYVQQRYHDLTNFHTL